MQLAMDKRFSTERTNHVLQKLALLHASRISSAATRECILRHLNTGDFPALCNYSLAYTDVSVSDAIEIRQVLAFYQKREDLDIGIDKEAAARASFMDSELRCMETNKKFRSISSGSILCPPDVNAILYGASRKIASVLGTLPDLRDLRIKFGPGATTTIPKRMASPKRKLSEGFFCSEGLVQFLPDLLEEVPGWCSIHCTSETEETFSVPVGITDGTLSFVPKNAKTYRSIVVEPVLNSFIQSGIGDYIAKRLLRVGIDITDQTANQRAAREGSVTGALATLDLSNASDTIATELVYHLLPIDWALALDACRSRHVSEPGGDRIKLHKFSSMGNGFTFPLETLIFWALASAASENDPRVLAYGDDLVVPTEYARQVIDALTYCGFVVNESKSYTSGPFRESCGKDYLSGIDIRPVYVKDRINYLDLFRLHNYYYANLDKEACAIVLDEIPFDIQVWGPPAYGDGHLHSDAPLTPYKRSEGWAGFIFDTYSAKPRRDFVSRIGDRVLPAYSIYVRGGAGESQGFTRHNGRGAPGDQLPGDRGYKRISIYTLHPF